MARLNDRAKAIRLRKQGKTYSEIRREINVSKSTLSDWIAKLPLTTKQIIQLEKTRKKNKFLSIEKIRITKQKKRESRINVTYKREKERWSSLSKKELELAGIFLYWGEGTKRMNGPIVVNNTDPEMLTFTLCWMVNALEIPKKRIKVTLQLYKDMDIKKEMKYWSKVLKLPLSQFAKPYIKQSTRVKIDHKGFGHGTCGLLVSNILIKEKIMMTIKAISNYYAERLEVMV
ncbi:MAG: helix-turn-helix domain-containing protein [Candidatus Levyibacteriota bacterium]